jgi:hypothetical protein
VLLGAPTSLAIIMAIGPHHAAVTRIGPAGAHGSAGYSRGASAGLSFCVLVAILSCLPRPAAPSGGGGVPAPPARGVRPADTPPPTPPAAGAPPAGPWQELAWRFALQRLA